MNPLCPTNVGIKDTELFLLLCPSFDILRQDLLAVVSELLPLFVQIDTLPDNVLDQYLLYGNKELSNDVNRNMLEHTLNFIHKAGRLLNNFKHSFLRHTATRYTFPRCSCKSVSHLVLGT